MTNTNCRKVSVGQRQLASGWITPGHQDAERVMIWIGEWLERMAPWNPVVVPLRRDEYLVLDAHIRKLADAPIGLPGMRWFGGGQYATAILADSRREPAKRIATAAVRVLKEVDGLLNADQRRRPHSVHLRVDEWVVLAWVLWCRSGETINLLNRPYRNVRIRIAPCGKGFPEMLWNMMVRVDEVARKGEEALWLPSREWQWMDRLMCLVRGEEGSLAREPWCGIWIRPAAV